MAQTTGQGQGNPVHTWTGPGGSRRFRLAKLLDIRHMNVSLMHRPPLTQRDTLGARVCQRLSRPYGHSAAVRNM